MIFQEDFDDDTLLLGGEDDLLGSDEPSGVPQEDVPPEETVKSPVVHESENTKPSQSDPKPEAEPESNTLTEDPCSESDDDGGDVQASVAQTLLLNIDFTMTYDLKECLSIAPLRILPISSFLDRSWSIRTGFGKGTATMTTKRRNRNLEGVASNRNE